MITTHIKQPGETYPASPRFDTRLQLWELIDVAIDTKGLVPGSQLLSYEYQLANGEITLQLTGGTDGEIYLVTVRAKDTSDAILESEMEIAVIDETWALPDGGAPYLSIIGFVNRFGLDEVVRMTDEDGSGRIGRQMLISALTDAQADADAELSKRYPVPLSTVPRVVETAIADIARSRLYPKGVPEAVAANAKTAAKKLERMGTGDLLLGLPAASEPAAQSDTPVMFSGGRRAYPDGLADY